MDALCLSNYCSRYIPRNMNFRRYQRRFLILLVFVVVSIFMTHMLWNEEENSTCIVSAETSKKIDALMGLIQEPLKVLNLSFFLCYNTLWGALKVQGVLPWQSSLNLCVLNKEMSAIDEGFLARTFKHYGFSITYNSARGTYKVVRIDETVPYVTLTVFEEDLITHQMRRVGWIHRMLPPNACEELNCFPPELIEKPLPTAKFNKYTLPVPRDGIEIQKYLFPYSWWKEIGPQNCQEISQ